MKPSSINIDFQVLVTHDPKVLVVADTSDWAHIVDKPAIIEIIIPGNVDPIVHYWSKGDVNVFNSSNLMLGCGECDEAGLGDLPDGIYQITLKGSPDSFNKTRQYLKSDITRRDIDKAVSTLNLGCGEYSRSYIDKVQKIELFMSAADSNARLGNFCEAQDLLFKVQKLAAKLKKCKQCV